MSSWLCLISLACCLASCLCVTGTLKHINGVLVNVIDDCDVNDPNSCGAGKCCVKEGMAYIPEALGPKPAYVIQCRDLGARGHFCYANTKTHEMCPCAAGLTCQAGILRLFGHCN